MPPAGRHALCTGFATRVASRGSVLYHIRLYRSPPPYPRTQCTNRPSTRAIRSCVLHTHTVPCSDPSTHRCPPRPPLPPLPPPSLTPPPPPPLPHNVAAPAVSSSRDLFAPVIPVTSVTPVAPTAPVALSTPGPGQEEEEDDEEDEEEEKEEEDEVEAAAADEAGEEESKDPTLSAY